MHVAVSRLALAFVAFAAAPVFAAAAPRPRPPRICSAAYGRAGRGQA